MLYALLHKNKLIGLYNNYKCCSQMLTGLVTNNFADQTNLKIVNYYDNSITICTEKEVEIFTSDSDSDSNTLSTENLDDSTKKKIKNAREKQSKVEYNVTLLKKQKEALEESKNIFQIDYELFKKFKKLTESNTKFEIPELFLEKYKLMLELESTNNLKWETFHQQYKKQTMNTSYDTLFDGRTKERAILVISSSEDNSSE